MRDRLTPAVVLPVDHANATLIGRAWVPARGGPVPVLVMEDGLHDLSGVAPTVDRFGLGQGCTHMVCDVLTVHTPRLGALVNRVNLSNKTEPWTLWYRGADFTPHTLSTSLWQGVFNLFGQPGDMLGFIR